MNLFVPLLCCLAAFGALALASERAQLDLFGAALAARLTFALRAAGWTLLALALALLVGRSGWALGLVGFSGLTSLAAGLVHLALIGHVRWHGSKAERA